MDDLLSKLGNDPKKVRYIEWLCTAPELREPDNQLLLADELGVTDRTLRNWKTNATFITEWDRLSRKVVGSPENTQRLLQNLLSVGLDDTHKQMTAAARLFLQTTGAILPTKAEDESESSPLKDLSIDDLKALAAQAAQAELHKRQASDRQSAV